jgi:hypothetical protein
MMFAELPEWIRQVLRGLSRDGYIYIGRSGVGLSYAFRKGPSGPFCSTLLSVSPRPQGPLTECMKQGTIRAVDQLASKHDLGYRFLLEQVAIEGPKWVSYERIKELCEKEPMKALRADLV